MKKADFILIIFLLSLTAYFIVTAQKKESNAVLVEVTTNNSKVLYKLSINRTLYFKGNNASNTIEIKDGRVKVIEASCSDLICLNSKEISKVGESIICLPNRFMIKILGDRSEIDALSQ